MQTRRRIHNAQHRRKGAILVLIVVCLPIFLIFAAFSISLAYMQLTRTELRVATDAATRAGGRTLSLQQDVEEAERAATEAAALNNVAGKPLKLAASDIQWGLVRPRDTGRWEFESRNRRAKDINALRVTGRRTTDSPSGGVPLPFTAYLGSELFEPVKSSTTTQINRDVALVLDRSGSMSWSTSRGSRRSRWEDLNDAVDVFLEVLESTPVDEYVALVSYEETTTLDEALTPDYPRINAAMQSLSPNGSTGIGRGLEVGKQAVSDPSHRRVYAAQTIVLMTDGHHNAGTDPIAVARAMANSGIIVHTVTFSDGANQADMREVARLCGGGHWHANNRNELLEAFREIANNLPTLMTE